jgi:DNA-binding CsgD family transcriptional regulator
VQVPASFRIWPGPTRLIDRRAECKVLEDLVEAVRAGKSRALVVLGEPGVGKTALLDYLTGHASGCHIARAGGGESEMELAFSGLHVLCAPMLDRLDRIPAPQHAALATAFALSAGEPPDRFIVGLAVLSLLAEVAEEQPLLCLVDDAQWLDQASALTLAFVARRLLAERVGIVFATRDAVEQHAFSRFPELLVQGLSAADARAVLETGLRGRLDPAIEDRLVAETRGNPLALLELPRAMTPAELAGGFGVPAPARVAGRVEEGFLRRIERLPPPTQRLLLVAAAEPLGDPAVVWRAATILGVAADSATPAIAEGLVQFGPRVVFRHPLVRSAAYTAAALPDRQAAHRALAEATDPDLDPDRLAWHRALGAPGPDEDIARALEQSAHRAQARGGLAAAAALLERSVGLTVDPHQRTERIFAAVAAHLEAGSFELAAALLPLAEAAPLDDMGRARLDLWRARLAYARGDNRDAPGLLWRAAARLEPLDVSLANDTYIQAMGAATVAGNFAYRSSLREIAHAANLLPMPPSPTSNDFLRAGLARITAEGPLAAAPLLRRALAASASETISTQTLYWLGYQGVAASVLWDNESLHRLLARQVAVARDLGALTMLPTALTGLARVLMLEGDLDKAATLVAEADRIVEATGANLVSWAGPMLAAWRGDADSMHSIDHLIASARAAGHGFAMKNGLWAGAILHNGIAHYERALAFATEADLEPWESSSHWFFHELIEAAVRSGQPGIAERTLERLAETVVPSGSKWGMGIYTRSQALLATASMAEDLYNDALALLTESIIRPELARTHLLYGEWLRRESRRVDARTHLRTAFELFTEMGIHAFAERTRRELLATGKTVRKRTTDKENQLTPQESQIARLARDGLSNPEIASRLFISARTVQFHLSKVFTKLGINSRSQLHRVLPPDHDSEHRPARVAPESRDDW